jgi:hypothetical protein
VRRRHAELLREPRQSLARLIRRVALYGQTTVPSRATPNDAGGMPVSSCRARPVRTQLVSSTPGIGCLCLAVMRPTAL